MAMVVEQAGGRASDGCTSLMDVQPQELHERTPVFMGSREFVEMAERVLAEDG